MTEHLVLNGIIANPIIQLTKDQFRTNNLYLRVVKAMQKVVQMLLFMVYKR
ncbi:MAG: hypothetical protein IJ756_05515 [Paludibacteraceae bacterium]|nr:hypothetical protein [Paludibacteraceae bacterium]